MDSKGDKLIGQKLGSYQILEAIGQGGMARVYKGYHPDLNRYAAVKVITWGLAEDEDFSASFRREAQAIASLRHPRIVTIFDFGQYDHGYYLVMEYIDGQDLGEFITLGKSFSPEEIISIIIDIASAIDYAHRLDVIHRDVKPSNIMMAGSGEAILTDFGLVMLPNSMGATTMGNAFGTPYYIAPEQAVSAAAAVPASDIYSLGIVLFELIAGVPPYTADSPLGIALKHISDPIPNIQDFVPDTPDAVSAVIQKAMAKEPEDRFATATEMAETLAQVWDASEMPLPKVGLVLPANTVAAPLRPIAPPYAPPSPAQTVEPDPSGRKLSRLLWGIGTVAVLLLLSFGVWLTLQQSNSSPTPTATQVIAAANPPTTTSTPEPTPSPMATATLEEVIVLPTDTLEPSSTPTETPSPVPEPSATPTATQTPLPTETPTETPTTTPAP